MNIQNLLRLPRALRMFRTRAGLSQKALALSIGVDQAVLCAVEKGRRGSLPDEAMRRLPDAAGLSETESDQLRVESEHDRLLREATTGPFSGALELLSVTLLAYQRHGPRARQGLVEMLRRAADSGQEVMELERLADSAPHAKEGPMT